MAFAADGSSADRQLARRIGQGDEAAFEELVRRHHPRLSRIAGRFFRRPEVVEEVLQEVFVKAYAAIDGYRGEMPLEHWLSRITVNACHDQLRRQKARPESLVSQLPNEDGFPERLEPRAEPGFWEREEARLLAEQLLSLLAPAERLVLTLLVLEELPVAEVARLTGWSRTNVKVRAFRARSRLRKLARLGPERRPAHA